MGDIDGGWAWIVLVGCTVMTTIMAGTDKCFGLIYLEMLEVFDDKAATTAWVTALAITIRSMLGPVVSVLCSRFGCRAVAIAGGLITSTGMILSAFRFSLAYMFFTFGICTGVGTALLQTAIYINIAQHFKKKVTLALCINSGGGGIGAMIAPLVFILFLDKYGFSGTMLLFGGIMAHLIPAGALSRSQTKTNVLRDDIIADASVTVEGESDDDDDAEKIDASVKSLFDQTISPPTQQSTSIDNSTASAIYVRVER
ncbi:monocarboxylate transporter 12-like, partial [Lineus longissimus]|uniref:monocarboxylate transporter 12-like n=1 Tax=Lineus longissimus TaxID=88925 RepID=UPI00315C7F35